MKRFPLGWMLLVPASLMLADGGRVIFHKTAGDFDVTLFANSDTIRAGANDLSVLVQEHDSTVMNAAVLLRLERTQESGEIMRLTSIATHAKATNKTLYAANVNIPADGQWRLNVDVTTSGHSGVASGEITVQPPLPAVQNYWPFVAMVPLVGIAFLINRKLRAKYRSPRS